MVESKEREQKASSRAEEAFAEYLDRLDGGESLAFDTFCATRPDLAPDLRRLQRSWSHVSKLVDRLGLRPDGPKPASEREVVDVPSIGEARRIALDHEPPAGDPVPPSKTLTARLADRVDTTRYVPRELISKGGQGEVRGVWDTELRRPLAMKSMLRRGMQQPKEREVGRFLEEAQITGQLDHPGVVPVHELGLDKDGGLFFTMRLVRGRTLGEVFTEVGKGSETWTLARALGVILRVCETMAFAHERGVVHRDLKPANIMVGRFGEVYVMDWGLAHVLGTEDTKDIRLAGEPSSGVWTDRREVARRSPDSPLITMDGDVVGTPAYMSPEQAEGQVVTLEATSDVYSVGAILYQLLSGHMPYEDSTQPTPVSPHVLWRRVLSGPPTSLENLDGAVAPELLAITERAMQRDPKDRFPTMLEMANELRAFLEGRVVATYKTGPVVEFQKWVRRNRGFAAAVAASVVVLFAGALLYAWNESRRTAEIERYAIVGRAEELLENADALGPIHPDSVDEMEAWLTEARSLLTSRAFYENQLARVRKRALPVEEAHLRADALSHPRRVEYRRLAKYVDDAQLTIKQLRSKTSDWRTLPWTSPAEAADIMERHLPLHRSRLKRVRREVERRRLWEFASEDDQQDHEQLLSASEALARLAKREKEIVQTLETGRSLAERSVDAYRERWAEATEAIAMHGFYDGLALAPQVGLVPLGQDPRSSLWEFWHVLSGDEPVRDSDGRLMLNETSGIVLVLIPGMEATMGAQSLDAQGKHFDPAASKEEKTIELELAPYFLAKHETTQSQWHRLSGEVPSFFYLGSHWQHLGATSGLHPVENLSWQEADRTLARAGLELPTEARWEFGARSLSEDPYYFGRALSGEFRVNTRSVGQVSDAYPFHAPVDASAPNAFGLHGVHGNVREFCLDRWSDGIHRYPNRPGTGEILCEQFSRRAVRAGSYSLSAPYARVTSRSFVEPDNRSEDIGVRAARSVEGPNPGAL